MFTKLLSTLWISSLLVFQLSGGSAKPIDARDGDELVQTPGGLIPKSNVHLVPEGATIVHTPTQVQIIGADGTTLRTVPLSPDDSNQRTTPAMGTSSPSHPVRRALQSGWDAYAYWIAPASSAIAFFSTYWTVPPLPASWDGQLLYIFNGLSPIAASNILQPVLQFGVSPAGGGPYWAIASWYVVGTQGFHSNLTQVSPGQNLQGYMQEYSLTGSTASWFSMFQVNNQQVDASILQINTTDVYLLASETLEIYTTSTRSDLPTGSTSMNNILLLTQTGFPSQIPWTTVNDTADGLSASVASYSSTAGEVIIHYPA